MNSETIQHCEHLVENLLCVRLALLDSSSKADFQVRKPESLGIAKSHTERYCQHSAPLVSGARPSQQLLVIPNREFQKVRVKSIFVSAVSAFCLETDR